MQSLNALRINSLQNGSDTKVGSDKIQKLQELFANKEKELELQHVKSPHNSIAVVKETLLNNTDVFNTIFHDDTLFSSLNEKDFFDRLNKVFNFNQYTKENLKKRNDIDEVINKVTGNQEIKQKINQQLEKTKLFKNKLDEIKDELFTDYEQDEDESS